MKIFDEQPFERFLFVLKKQKVQPRESTSSEWVLIVLISLLHYLPLLFKMQRESSVLLLLDLSNRNLCMFTLKTKNEVS